MSNTLSNNVLVMIVDDQLNSDDKNAGRKKSYKAFITKMNEQFAGKWILDHRFCATPNELASIPSGRDRPSLAIVDMVLDTPEWTPKKVDLLDRKLLSDHWPMLLVSARFGSPEAIDRANKLIEGATENKTPFQFLIWSFIVRATEGFDDDSLAIIIDSVLSRAQAQDIRFRKLPDEPIDILHITDPHFGKAKWDIGSIMTLRDVCQSSMSEDKLAPADFLAITGDIAHQGAPDEYRKAIDYFNSLADHMIITRSESGLLKDRVFLCPGNHDFSRCISLGANIKGDKTFSVENAEIPDRSWVRSFAWTPYEQFETAIAGHTERWIPAPGFRINSRFLNTGIIILELNIEQYAIENYQLGLTNEQIKTTLNNAVTGISEVRKSNECIIILSHRYESDLWKELSRSMDNALRGLSSGGPVILLCGHQHKEKISAELKGGLFVINGIPPSTGASLPEGVLPMVNWVRLIRENGGVTGVVVHQFHLGADGWFAKEGALTRFSYQNKIWQQQAEHKLRG